MTQFDTELSTQNSDQRLWELQKSVKTLQQSRDHQLKPLTVLRWIGYGFLLLFLFDLIEILYPPQFMNPAWEFRTLGQLVERVLVPLIGFVLVIVGGRDTPARVEQTLLKVLSWSTLVFALVFYLSIPLGIFNTIRLNQQLNIQVMTQLEQQMAQVEVKVQAVKDQVNQVNTVTDLQAFLSQLNLQQAPEIQSESQLETVKQQIAASMDNQLIGMENQAKTKLANQRQQLLMRSAKWNLGALVSATLFLLLWKETDWARR
ncbi:MAG: hypothetical protein F6J90_15545 [Moorea sp. SIOASIH]|uniref:HpsJ-like protein, cyanoexosortase A-associated n=1 Tax=Moorena sp. SIOASIH TaxID=2607817 RepID=UPI0013BBBD6F|nr:HpsJ family protein [Moorena sp. SIOASIH]NEO37665.1 hypothetical protein [Moorena sp. SIOASIH]